MQRSTPPLMFAAALVLGGCWAAPARPRPFGREPPGDPSFAPSPTGGSDVYTQPTAAPTQPTADAPESRLGEDLPHVEGDGTRPRRKPTAPPTVRSADPPQR